MTFANEMLTCARFFHEHQPDARCIPSEFDDQETAIGYMLESLLYEANSAMQNTIDFPENPILNPVDLDTAEPGIIESKEGSNLKIKRSNDASVPKQIYKRRNIETIDNSKVVDLPAEKIEKELKSAEARATKSHESAEKKEVVKRIKKENRRAGVKPQDEKTTEEKDKDTVEKKKEKKERKPVDAEEKMKKMIDDDIQYGSGNVDKLRTIKKNKEVSSIFESPIPHDRHLSALTICKANENLLPTLLRGEPSSGLKIIQGPPGTGKTTRLLTDLLDFCQSHPNSRCIVCSPTNVGAADLYKRSLSLGIVGFLSLNKKNVPPDVPTRQFVDEMEAKVIFCTVSGRNSNKLIQQRIHAVFLDEAALCPEALVWGLLREETEYLYMVGDINQLRAIVSVGGSELEYARSMMERLLSLGVESEVLRVQRRMHPEILSFPNRQFYDGLLQTDTSNMTELLGLSTYEVIPTQGCEERVGTSYKNECEAEKVVSVASELRDIAPDASVVILTPYLAQKNSLLSHGSGIPVHTVDSFQGKEADVVVISLVRSADEGFWSEGKRVVVALTRAKKALRVVGCFSHLNPDSHLKILFEDAQKRNCLRN